jgi:hypothetical protein
MPSAAMSDPSAKPIRKTSVELTGGLLLVVPFAGVTIVQQISDHIALTATASMGGARSLFFFGSAGIALYANPKMRGLFVEPSVFLAANLRGSEVDPGLQVGYQFDVPGGVLALRVGGFPINHSESSAVTSVVLLRANFGVEF